MFGLTPLATLSLAMALASIVTKPVISEAIWHMHCLASRLILTPVGRLCAMIRVTLVSWPCNICTGGSCRISCSSPCSPPCSP